MISDDFEGKEKLLSAAFSNLQQRQASFRRAVASAYENAVSQNAPSGKSAVNEIEENDTQAVTQPPAWNDDSTAQGNNAAPESRTENGGENGTSKNGILLDTIHAALLQIESAIHLTDRAVAKSDVVTIRLGATRIADASLKISGLSLLLDIKGKENLYMLAASLQHAAENLRKMAKKNTSVRSKMEDSMSEMRIKFSNLSTGISFVR